MADLQEFSVTRNGNVNVGSTSRYDISARITDSDTGAIIQDYTGANILIWPTVLATLTEAQREVFIRDSAILIVHLKAGLR